MRRFCCATRNLNKILIKIAELNGTMTDMIFGLKIERLHLFSIFLVRYLGIFPECEVCEHDDFQASFS